MATLKHFEGLSAKGRQHLSDGGCCPGQRRSLVVPFRPSLQDFAASMKVLWEQQQAVVTSGERRVQAELTGCQRGCDILQTGSRAESVFRR